MSKPVVPKTQALAHWRQIEPGADPLPLMDAIPYRSPGSKYGCCGIRIDGSPEFVDAVLSNLKTLISGENGATRLEFTRRSVGPVEINGKCKSFANASRLAEVCYIRLHERGRESQMAHAMLEMLAGEHEAPEVPGGLFE